MPGSSSSTDRQASPANLDRLIAFCTDVAHNAGKLDVDGAFPEDEIAGLHALGFLHAPLPVEAGGIGLAQSTSMLRRVLGAIGAASLPLGRLYEGHVNAVRLVDLYGEPHHLEQLRREADAGRLTGVWNAEDAHGLRLVEDGDGLHLTGRKIWASGAAHIRRPLVTAANGAAGVTMLLPEVSPDRADTSKWRAHGMRASETGIVDFTRLRVTNAQLVGQPGDYYRSPHFAGGAWRVLAVQFGAMTELFAIFRRQLTEGPRAKADHFRVLLGRAGVALETARLWVKQASERASGVGEPADVDAYVNLARTAFERCALDLMECVQRGLGLNGFLAGNPAERIIRDLSTYLRQPFPDKALDQAIDRLLHDQLAVIVDE